MAKPIHREEAAAFRWLLREFRVGAGMKQAELSAALNKPQPYISAIETGQRRVDIVELRDICAALSVELPEFARQLEDEIREGRRHQQARRRVRVD